jgi:energy-coupling factor transport system ATP-binding protein
LTALSRLNEDLGLTVVLAEHRLERVLGHADRLRFMPGPSSHERVLDGAPRSVLRELPLAAVPPLVALGRRLGWEPLPLSIREGRAAVRRDSRLPTPPPPEPAIPGGAPVLALQRLSAGHGRAPVLREVDLEVRPGELVALMGRNGSGKTTLLRTAMGLHRPSGGRVVVFGRDAAGLDASDRARAGAGYVPQNPGSLLFAERLRDELAFTRKHLGARDAEPDAILARLGLAEVADRNPRDLSGGERERAALAAVLVGGPRLLMLDEPTRGMDYARKRDLGEILSDLCRDGVAVVLATHDVELVATIASRVVLLGDGGIVADGSPRIVLSGSLTYTTQVNKLYGDGFLTVADVIAGLEEAPGA